MPIDKAGQKDIDKYIRDAAPMDPYVRKYITVRGKEFGVPVKRKDGGPVDTAGLILIQAGIANLLHFAEMNQAKDDLLEKAQAVAFGQLIIAPEDREPGGNLHQEQQG